MMVVILQRTDCTVIYFWKVGRDSGSIHTPMRKSATDKCKKIKYSDDRFFITLTVTTIATILIQFRITAADAK